MDAIQERFYLCIDKCCPFKTSDRSEMRRHIELDHTRVTRSHSELQSKDKQLSAACGDTGYDKSHNSWQKVGLPNKRKKSLSCTSRRDTYLSGEDGGIKYAMQKDSAVEHKRKVSKCETIAKAILSENIDEQQKTLIQKELGEDRPKRKNHSVVFTSFHTPVGNAPKRLVSGLKSLKMSQSKTKFELIRLGRKIVSRKILLGAYNATMYLRIAECEMEYKKFKQSLKEKPRTEEITSESNHQKRRLSLEKDNVALSTRTLLANSVQKMHKSQETKVGTLPKIGIKEEWNSASLKHIVHNEGRLKQYPILKQLLESKNFTSLEINEENFVDKEKGMELMTTCLKRKKARLGSYKRKLQHEKEKSVAEGSKESERPPVLQNVIDSVSKRVSKTNVQCKDLLSNSKHRSRKKMNLSKKGSMNSSVKRLSTIVEEAESDKTSIANNSKELRCKTHIEQTKNMKGKNLKSESKRKYSKSASNVKKNEAFNLACYKVQTKDQQDSLYHAVLSGKPVDQSILYPQGNSQTKKSFKRISNSQEHMASNVKRQKLISQGIKESKSVNTTLNDLKGKSDSSLEIRENGNALQELKKSSEEQLMSSEYQKLARNSHKIQGDIATDGKGQMEKDQCAKRNEKKSVSPKRSVCSDRMTERSKKPIHALDSPLQQKTPRGHNVKVKSPSLAKKARQKNLEEIIAKISDDLEDQGGNDDHGIQSPSGIVVTSYEGQSRPKLDSTVLEGKKTLPVLEKYEGESTEISKEHIQMSVSANIMDNKKELLEPKEALSSECGPGGKSEGMANSQDSSTTLNQDVVKKALSESVLKSKISAESISHSSKIKGKSRHSKKQSGKVSRRSSPRRKLDNSSSVIQLVEQTASLVIEEEPKVKERPKEEKELGKIREEKLEENMDIEAKEKERWSKKEEESGGDRCEEEQKEDAINEEDKSEEGVSKERERLEKDKIEGNSGEICNKGEQSEKSKEEGPEEDSRGEEQQINEGESKEKEQSEVDISKTEQRLEEGVSREQDKSKKESSERGKINNKVSKEEESHGEVGKKKERSEEAVITEETRPNTRLGKGQKRLQRESGIRQKLRSRSASNRNRKTGRQQSEENKTSNSKDVDDVMNQEDGKTLMLRSGVNQSTMKNISTEENSSVNGLNTSEKKTTKSEVSERVMCNVSPVIVKDLTPTTVQNDTTKSDVSQGDVSPVIVKDKTPTTVQNDTTKSDVSQNVESPVIVKGKTPTTVQNDTTKSDVSQNSASPVIVKGKTPTTVQNDTTKSDVSQNVESPVIVKDKTPTTVQNDTAKSDVSQNVASPVIVKDKTPTTVQNDIAKSDVSWNVVSPVIVKDITPTTVQNDIAKSDVSQNDVSPVVVKDKTPTTVQNDTTKSDVSRNDMSPVIVKDKTPTTVHNDITKSDVSQGDVSPVIVKDKTPTTVHNDTTKSDVSRNDMSPVIVKDKTPTTVHNDTVSLYCLNEKPKPKRSQSNVSTSRKRRPAQLIGYIRSKKPRKVKGSKQVHKDVKGPSESPVTVCATSDLLESLPQAMRNEENHVKATSDGTRAWQLEHVEGTSITDHISILVNTEDGCSHLNKNDLKTSAEDILQDKSKDSELCNKGGEVLDHNRNTDNVSFKNINIKDVPVDNMGATSRTKSKDKITSDFECKDHSDSCSKSCVPIDKTHEGLKDSQKNEDDACDNVISVSSDGRTNVKSNKEVDDNKDSGRISTAVNYKANDDHANDDKVHVPRDDDVSDGNINDISSRNKDETMRGNKEDGPNDVADGIPSTCNNTDNVSDEDQSNDQADSKSVNEEDMSNDKAEVVQVDSNNISKSKNCSADSDSKILPKGYESEGNLETKDFVPDCTAKYVKQDNCIDNDAGEVVCEEEKIPVTEEQVLGTEKQVSSQADDSQPSSGLGEDDSVISDRAEPEEKADSNADSKTHATCISGNVKVLDQTEANSSQKNPVSSTRLSDKEIHSEGKRYYSESMAEDNDRENRSVERNMSEVLRKSDETEDQNVDESSDEIDVENVSDDSWEDDQSHIVPKAMRKEYIVKLLEEKKNKWDPFNMYSKHFENRQENKRKGNACIHNYAKESTCYPYRKFDDLKDLVSEEARDREPEKMQTFAKIQKEAEDSLSHPGYREPNTSRVRALFKQTKMSILNLAEKEGKLPPINWMLGEQMCKHGGQKSRMSADPAISCGFTPISTDKESCVEETHTFDRKDEQIAEIEVKSGLSEKGLKDLHVDTEETDTRPNRKQCRGSKGGNSSRSFGSAPLNLVQPKVIPCLEQNSTGMSLKSERIGQGEDCREGNMGNKTVSSLMDKPGKSVDTINENKEEDFRKKPEKAEDTTSHSEIEVGFDTGSDQNMDKTCRSPSSSVFPLSDDPQLPVSYNENRSQSSCSESYQSLLSLNSPGKIQSLDPIFPETEPELALSVDGQVGGISLSERGAQGATPVTNSQQNYGTLKDDEMEQNSSSKRTTKDVQGNFPCDLEKQAGPFHDLEHDSCKRTCPSSKMTRSQTRSRLPSGFKEMQALMTNSSYIPGYNPYVQLCSEVPRGRSKDGIGKASHRDNERASRKQRDKKGWELRKRSADRTSVTLNPDAEDMSACETNYTKLLRNKKVRATVGQIDSAGLKKTSIIDWRDVEARSTETIRGACRNNQKSRDDISTSNSLNANRGEMMEQVDICMEDVLSFEPVSVSCDDVFKDVGALVWGKRGQDRWWPAIKIPGSLAGMTKAEPGMVWLFWFGDHKISKIPEDRVQPFISSYHTLLQEEKAGRKFLRGVDEALMVCEQRCNIDTESDMDMELRQWADKDFPLPPENWPAQASELVRPVKAYPVPDFVAKRLQEISQLVHRDVKESNDQDVEEALLSEGKSRDDTCSAIDLVFDGERKIEEICLACDDADAEVVCQHPLFIGGLCSNCKEVLMSTSFDLGADGTGHFCAICSAGGKIYVCDNLACYRTYCNTCISTYLGDDGIGDVEEADPWMCFLCQPYCAETHGPLYPRTNWKENIRKLFHSSTTVEVPDIDCLRSPSQKPRIRVLSLFDGIGTGKLALEKLGLDLEVYYACEIDPDCKLITQINNGNSVIQLGDVRDLTQEKLESLGDIDLLLAGSPSEKLTSSGREQNSKDFEGDIFLFFEFFRIWSILYMNAQKNSRHVFWMYENVAGIVPHARLLISKYLKCSPALWDANFFSPVNKACLLWGNIPTIYSHPAYLAGVKSKVKLNGMLASNLNRVARFEAVRTLPRTDPCMEGEESCPPVLMNGKLDHIWPVEIEKILGLPPHYTDVGYVSRSRKYQVLREAWSVEVTKEALKSLTKYFKRKTE